MATQVKFGEWIEKGFNLYKQNFGLLVLCMLITGLLSGLSLGIVAGPMMAGFYLVILGLIDNKTPKPQVGDIFKGFSFFLQSFLFLLVWGLILVSANFILAFIPCIGQITSIFLMYSAQALLMFGIFLIADRGMEFWPASMKSMEIVKSNFWPFLGFFIVSALISSLGAIACGIGVIFTAPIGYCAVAVAYRDIMSGQASPVEAAPAQAPIG